MGSTRLENSLNRLQNPLTRLQNPFNKLQIKTHAISFKTHSVSIKQTFKATSAEAMKMRVWVDYMCCGKICCIFYDLLAWWLKQGFPKDPFIRTPQQFLSWTPVSDQQQMSYAMDEWVQMGLTPWEWTRVWNKRPTTNKQPTKKQPTINENHPKATNDQQKTTSNENTITNHHRHRHP